MLVRHLKHLVESPYLREKFLGGSDEQIKDLLSIAGSSASAMCASLVYRWIARQLIPDKLPQYIVRGSFGDHLDLVEKWRLAKLYKKYQDSVMDYQVRKVMWEVQELSVEYLLTEPYEALIQDPGDLYCRVIAGAKFSPWSKLTADGLVSTMFLAVDRAVQKAFGAEKELHDHLGDVMENYFHQANQSGDFYGLLSIKSTSFGHAIGIRFEVTTGKVHWFDPNVGHYVFPSWSKTVEALQLYWRILWMDETLEGDVFPTKAQFQQWMLVQYRRKPKDPDLSDFLWDTTELKL